jgi:hypothetical protein
VLRIYSVDHKPASTRGQVLLLAQERRR